MPRCGLLGRFTTHCEVRCASITSLYHGPSVGGVVLFHVSALRRRFTRCRRIGTLALLPRPFSLRGNRLAGALGIGHPIIGRGCTTRVRTVCGRWMGEVDVYRKTGHFCFNSPLSILWIYLLGLGITKYINLYFPLVRRAGPFFNNFRTTLFAFDASNGPMTSIS